MSLKAKIFLNLLAGAVAGAIAWVLTDLTDWFSDVLNAQQNSGFNPKYLLYGAVFGAILGLLLGVVEGLSMDSQRQLIITLCVATAVGFAGGGLGLMIGQEVFGLIAPPDMASAYDSPQKYAMLLIGRSIGWAIVGCIIGLMQGLVRRSGPIVRQGAFGGFVGGALGGFVFQTVATILNTAALSRLCALVAIGGLVGFFIGLVPNLFKQAWIRVVLGRNEGKEYLIAKSVTTIGRSELSDIGLFGDPQIAPTHAVIEALAAQKRHRLRHIATGKGGKPGAFAPTVVNGQPVNSEQWLVDGDTIQIANRTLLFREKATRRAPIPMTIPTLAPLPIPDNATVSVAAPTHMPPAPYSPPRPSLTPSQDELDKMGVAPDSTPPVASGPIPPIDLTRHRITGDTLRPPPPRSIPPIDLTRHKSEYDKPLRSEMPRGPLPGDKTSRMETPRETPVTEAPADVTVKMDMETAAGEAGHSGVGRRLVCITGPYKGQAFPLGHMAVSIGRSSDCDVPLPADTSISRHHARITYTSSRHVLFDSGSSNGIRINGKRVVDSHVLTFGDIIMFGDTRMRYE